MIEYELELAKSRNEEKAHKTAVRLLKGVLDEAKKQGFEDPPIGSEPLPGKNFDYRGPIEKAIYTSLNSELGLTYERQFDGSSRLAATYNAVTKDFGLIDSEPTK